MLVLIGVTPPLEKTTRLRQRQGAEANKRIHKKGHCCRQQQNSDTNDDNLGNEAPKTRLQQQL